MLYRSWYERVYPRLSGYGLWLRGEELGRLPADAWDSRPYRLLIARLSSYFDAAESFGHQWLYRIAADTGSIFPDTAYLPLRSDAELFDRDNVPWLLGTGSKRDASEFDLLALSLSVVQELVNVPTVLKKSGIPACSEERIARDDLPLVIMGGASSLFSGMYWDSNSPVDAIFVGEDIGAIRELFSVCAEAKQAGMSKREVLSKLGSFEGVILPGSDHRTKKRKMSSELPQPKELPRPYFEPAITSFPLVITEGCPCFCTFCAESWDHKPYREHALPELLEHAAVEKQRMGASEVDVFSFNFNLYSRFRSLLNALSRDFDQVHLKSQRLDALSHDPELIAALKVMGKSSITVGVEGISKRLRAYLHKSLSDEELCNGFRALFGQRPRELKIFMIITGLESEADLAEFESLLRRLKEIREEAGAGARMVFSATPLVRFPWTPLEFADAPSGDEMLRIGRQIKHRVIQSLCEYREAAESCEYELSQTLVRARHPGVAAALLRSIESTGFVFYRGVPPEFWSVFVKELASEGLTVADVLKAPEQRESCPWSRVETGVELAFLQRTYEEAQHFEDSGYCLNRPWERGRCGSCGGCESVEEKRTLLQAVPETGPVAEKLGTQLRERRLESHPVTIPVVWSEHVRGVPRAMGWTVLMSSIFSACPEASASFRGYREDSRQSEWVSGADTVTVSFAPDGAAGLEELICSRRDAIDQALAPWGKLGVFGAALASEYSIISPFRFAPQEWLKRRGLKHTLRKAGEVQYFEISRDSAKKGIVTALRAEQCEASWSVQVTAGRKFEVEQFLREAFVLPFEGDWVRIVARRES